MSTELSAFIHEQLSQLGTHLTKSFGAVESFQKTLSSPELADKFSVYLELLEKWTKKVDLVAPAPIRDMVNRHVVDSAAGGVLIWTELAPGKDKSFLDVGSGAGLPGLILAVLDPERNYYLCEPKDKRVVFLKEAIRELGLKNCFPLQSRLEELTPADVPNLAITMTRALGDEVIFVGESARLMLDGGFAVEYAGPKWTDGTEDLLPIGVTFHKLIDYSLSPSGPPRKLAVWDCSV